MKKIFAITLILSLSFFLAGCSSKLQFAREISQEIIDALMAEDEEALYSMLSQSAKDYPQTREQIQAAFDFIDGEITSYELPDHFPAYAYVPGGGKVVENGEVTSESMTPVIKNIETDSGGKYRIWFSYYLVNDGFDESLEGLNQIMVSLVDENDVFIERRAIGFELKD